MRVGASEADWHKAIEDATKSVAPCLDAFVRKKFCATSAAKKLEALTPREPITATDLIMRYERLRAVHPYVQRTSSFSLPPKPTLKKDHERQARIEALLEMKQKLSALNSGTSSLTVGEDERRLIKKTDQLLNLRKERRDA